MAEAAERPVVVSVPASATESEPLHYRPVSGWAVAGLLVTGVYVIVIVVGGGIALYSWSPYLLPLWTLVLPLAGLALALFAQLHIRRAEGTRAGQGLARASWWTCLLLGAIYLSFYASTFLAVRQQADTFVRRWFDQLKAGHVNEAFLLTEHPEKRVNVSPQDEKTLGVRFDQGPMGQRGPLTKFRASELAQLIQQGGDEARIEGKGVQNWQFTEGNYEVTRLYQINTPEGEMEVTITTKGTESKSRIYDGRQWYLPWDSSGITRGKLTPFGERVQGLRAQGAVFLERWRKNLLTGTAETLESAYLDTQPPAGREARSKTYREGKLDLENFVNAKQLKAESDTMRKELLELLEGMFLPRKDDQTRLVLLTLSNIGGRRWEEVQGRMRFTFDATLSIILGPKPRCRSDVTLVIESEPGALDSGTSANWRLVRIEPTLAVDPLSPANMVREQ